VAGNPQGIRSLVKYSKLPAERIKYVPDADAATVLSIRRGILFLMAFWSGPSVQAFARLTEVLARLKAEGFELVVVDVDGSAELYELPESGGHEAGPCTGSPKPSPAPRSQEIVPIGLSVGRRKGWKRTSHECCP
jgi:hypothetical protein